MGSIDYMRDFFKMPRAVVRLLLPKNPSAYLVLSIILDRARYTEGPALGNGGLILGPGQCVVGRDELAIASGITPAQVRTALDLLKRLEILAIETTSRGTIVTVVGYGKNADSDAAESPAESPANRQQTASRSPANRQQTATNKKRRDGETQHVETPSLSALPLPDGWEPPAGARSEVIQTELACRIGDVTPVLVKFRNHMSSKNRRSADWVAEWETWCMRELEHRDKHVDKPKRPQKKKQSLYYIRLLSRDGASIVENVLVERDDNNDDHRRLVERLPSGEYREIDPERRKSLTGEAA